MTRTPKKRTLSVPAVSVREQFEATFLSSYDGFWICDGQGVVLRVNPASERINGIKEEEIVGRHVSLLQEWGAVDRCVTMEVLEKKRQVTIMQRSARSGKKLMVTATPIFDDQGRITLVITNDRDITELDDLRHQLLQSEARTEQFQQELLKRDMEERADSEIVGRSPVMRKVLAAARHVAKFKTNILISGASGTGKSLLANLIHKLSGRQDAPFVRVECGAIPASLFESEVFGYEKGAFTGANVTGKLGLFGMSDGGTLFLDEISQAPYGEQHKLLRFLETGELIRVGATKPTYVDARVIAATNVDLEERVEAGLFRSDLFYRLNIVPIQLPLLKDRQEDIPFLIQTFQDRFNERFNTDKRLSGPAVEALMRYDWPGNVRELENVMERLVVMSPNETIELSDLPEKIFGKAGLVYSLAAGKKLKEAVSEYEQDLIDLALQQYGNQSEAAKALGVSQATIARKRTRQ